MITFSAAVFPSIKHGARQLGHCFLWVNKDLVTHTRQNCLMIIQLIMRKVEVGVREIVSYIFRKTPYIWKSLTVWPQLKLIGWENIDKHKGHSKRSRSMRCCPSSASTLVTAAAIIAIQSPRKPGFGKFRISAWPSAGPNVRWGSSSDLVEKGGDLEGTLGTLFPPKRSKFALRFRIQVTYIPSTGEFIFKMFT